MKSIIYVRYTFAINVHSKQYHITSDLSLLYYVTLTPLMKSTVFTNGIGRAILVKSLRLIDAYIRH